MHRPSRFLRMLLIVCLTAAWAGVIAVAQPGLAGPPPPSLTGFSPNQGAQGATVNITLTGTNFAAKGLGLQFLPSSGMTVQKLQAVSATQISAQVQIAPSAQLGEHSVTLTVSGRNLQAPSPFTVTGHGCGQPGTPDCPNEGAAPPTLHGFSPLAARQGTEVTIVFTGSRFTSPAMVEFSPATGIAVQSTTVKAGNGKIEAQLMIDANAPLGARNVSLVFGKGKVRLAAQNTFRVERSAGPAAMEILRVLPNQIPAGGENLELTLQGRNFVPGITVSFTAYGNAPTDIFVVGAARYVDSTEIHVIVNVLPAALPGGRDIHLQAPNQQTTTGKGMLNVLAPTSNN